MDEYIGLDVSLKETTVSIRRGGKRVWRGKCPSDPQAIAALNRKNALFAGSDDGGDNWSVIASLIETAKLNRVDPQA